MIRDEHTTLGNSLLHHGPLNQRAYLLRLAPEDAADMPRRMHELAAQQGYGKLLARVPRDLAPPFHQAGFEVEAELPDYYSSGQDCLYMARYLDPQRRRSRDPGKVHTVLQHAHAAARFGNNEEHSFIEIAPDGVQELAALYARVFQAYPFPIFDPDHLRHCMQQGYRFFGLRRQGLLLAASCAEPDAGSQAVEFTDFATLPEVRRQGIASGLIRHMQGHMQERIPSNMISTLFTICRATSWGMNRAFAACGFAHAGTLWNNTHFNGRLEDMNIWVAHLQV